MRSREQYEVGQFIAQRRCPVIRPSYKNTGVSAGIFITPVGSGFEPAKKPFEPPQKGGRKYAGCAHAQFCKVMKHSEIIRLSAPVIKILDSVYKRVYDSCAKKGAKFENNDE